jgi:hypothetical protein
MLANPINNDTPQGLVNIPNVGQIVQAPSIPIPTEPKPLASTGNYAVPSGGIVGKINSYDADDDSEFEPIFWNDADILDESAFLGIDFKKIRGALGKAGNFIFSRIGKGQKNYVKHISPFGFLINNNDYTGGDDFSNYMGTDIEAVAPNFAAILKKAAESGVLHVPTRILSNQVYHLHLQETQPSSYTGEDYNNFDGISPECVQRHQAFFDGLSPGEQEMYSDFLGINFKAIGKAIGGVVKGVGKVVGKVGKAVGKAAVFTGKTIGKGAKLIGKGVVKAGKLGLKILASQAGLGGDQVTDQSNGGYLPTNWGAGPQNGGGYNPDWNPELGEDQEYDPNLADQNSFDLEDLRAAQDDTLLRQQAAAAVSDALDPEPPQTNILLWVALAAFLGLGFYLIKTKKL